MKDSLTESGMWTPTTAEDFAAVRQHLHQILSSPLFSNSKRYPNFLRYVVDETLSGRGELLKERSLGIDVFARKPDYDTNLDHIVRSTATEVRRRLSLFYQENGVHSAIRIDIPQRSYAPTFRRAAAAEAADSSYPQHRAQRKVSFKWFAYAGALSALVLVITGSVIKLFDARMVRASTNIANQPPQSLINLLAPTSGHHLNAVTNDSSLTALNAQKPDSFVSLHDYESGHFPDPTVHDWRTFYNRVEHDDLKIASRIYQSFQPAQVLVKLPSEISSEEFQEDNALLVGGPRGNPWAQLFEDSVNFKTKLPAGARTAVISDSNPRSDEQRDYEDALPEDGNPGRLYGRIAYFPASVGHAKVLLVSGPRNVATLGALAYATDTTALNDVLKLLGARSLSELPRFELLLEFTVTDNTITQSRVIAFRRQ